MRVLAFAGTSVGVAGLVTVLGAAVLYVRFYYAGLPPEQSIAAIPKTELVAFGASALILFVGFGLLAVVFVFTIDRLGRANARMAGGLVTLVGLEMLYTIWLTPLGDLDAVIATIDVNVFKWVLTALIAVAAIAGSILIAQRQLDNKASKAIAVLFALEIGFAGLVLLIDWSLALTLLLTALLGVALLRVADVTGIRFLPYGLAVFASLPLFGSIVTALRFAAYPEGQPIAVARKDLPAGSCGMYVAESSERLYIARASGRNGEGRLFWIPKDQVTAWSLGPARLLNGQPGRASVQTQAARLRTELLRAQPPAVQQPATEQVVRTERRQLPQADTTERTTFTRPRPAPPPPPLAPPPPPRRANTPC